jgi:sugar lactone lactonase YvrE
MPADAVWQSFSSGIEMKRTSFAAFLAAIAQLFFFIANAQADPSSGIVVDRQGRVYFADERRNVVWEIDTDGKLTAFVTSKHSHRLAIDEQGNIYGEHLAYIGGDRWEFHLWKATPSGELSYVIPPSPGFPPGSLMDKEGNRYQWGGSGNIKKTSSLIQKITPEGKVVTVAGSGWGWADGKGDKALFGSVGGIAWGKDGALYVTDGAAVRRVTLDGEVRTIVRDADALKPAASWRLFGGMGGHLFGLALDEELNIYVANVGGGQVAKVAPDGKVNTLVKSESGWAPTGVTVAGKELYILEHGPFGLRVRKLSGAGEITTLATVQASDQGGAVSAVIRTAERAGLDGDTALVGIMITGALVVLTIMAVFFRRIRRIIRDFQRKRLGAA